MIEIAATGENMGAGVGAGMGDSVKSAGVYTFTYRNPDGEIEWEEKLAMNIWPTAGRNFALDTLLAGSAYTATWFMGLVDGGSAPTYAAADTAASHAGWTENTGYSNANRVTPSFNAASAGSKATSAGLVFNINAAGTIAGGFLISNSTKGGTTGTLLSEASFSGGNQAVSNGGTLTVTATYSLT